MYLMKDRIKGSIPHNRRENVNGKKRLFSTANSRFSYLDQDSNPKQKYCASQNERTRILETLTIHNSDSQRPKGNA